MGLHMCGYFMSIICKISRIAEVAAEFRENVKNSHYKELAGYIFFETLGSLGSSFYLFQAISITIQRGNANVAQNIKEVLINK